jgi:glucose/arabinose dehydrogenase
MRNNRTALLLAAALVAGPAHGLTLPSGFSDTLVATVSNPTALAFTPDGRLLITTQAGTIRVVSGGALLPTPALTIPGGSICSGFERGLLGIVPDPAFASNGFIYVYYTFPKNGNCSANVANGPVHRISRFVLPAGNVINPATEAVIVDNIPCVNGNHNGGDLHFASDGKLYASVGDGGCQITNASNCQNANANARRQDIPLGKILRFNADGTIPADNPWVGLAGSRRCTDPAGVPAGAGPCQETWAWGLRIPFASRKLTLGLLRERRGRRRVGGDRRPRGTPTSAGTRARDVRDGLVVQLSGDSARLHGPHLHLPARHHRAWHRQLGL